MSFDLGGVNVTGPLQTENMGTLTIGVGDSVSNLAQRQFEAETARDENLPYGQRIPDASDIEALAELVKGLPSAVLADYGIGVEIAKVVSSYCRQFRGVAE